MAKSKNKALRIAMLGQKRIPSREGGVEIVVEELSVRMVQRGCNVTCYNRRGHHVSGKEFDSPQLSEYKGVAIKTVPTISCKGLAAVTSSFIGAIITAFGKYDVIHFHAEGPCAMCWFPKLLGKKVVCTIHGLDHKRSGKWNRLACMYILLGEKCAVKYADEIIVLSKGARKYFQDTYGRKTIFIPNGIDRPKIREAMLIRKKYGLDKDSYLLFLGRIVPEKGLRYLLEAFKNVRTDKKMVIAGGSSDTDKFMNELKRLCEGDSRVVFTGFVQGKELEELYSNAYVYCLPSDLEGMPLSLLEAMSYGNCCVVSDIEECEAVVEDKGVVFRKGNVEDLQRILQSLCDSPEIVEKYKEKASDFICEKYDWDDVVKKTLEVYRSIENVKW